MTLHDEPDPWDEDLDIDPDDLIRWSDGTWRIEDDPEANWALRKLDQKQREILRIEANARREIDRINAAKDAAVNTLKKGRGGTEFFEAVLVDYRRRLEQYNPDMPVTYKLPSGVITRRQGPTRMEVTDETAFIEWAERNDPDLYKRTALVSGLKNGYKIAGEKVNGSDVEQRFTVVTANGEPVPGVEQVTDPAVLSCKPY